MKTARFLLACYRIPILGHIARQILFIIGADIPRSVQIGHGFNLKHRGLGVVIHPTTRIGDDVAIFQGVTVGEAAVGNSSDFAGIRIANRAVLSAGAKVLAPDSGLQVGEGTIVGANAVLLQSTGDWEVWVGIPARCVAKRTH